MLHGFRIHDLGFKNKILFLILITCFLLLTSPTVLKAQSVDILWQGSTYTHPFYRGRTLWSNQSIIKFVAIPQGFSNPAGLNYKWTKNGTVLGNVSGVGRNSLTLADSILSRTQTIKVDIVNREGVSITSDFITLTPAPASLAVYEYSPLYGYLFNNEIAGTERLRDQEVTFAAFPLFFSANSRLDPAMSYEWRTNTGAVDTGNSVTYRTPSNASGSSRISVETRNSAKVMQSSSKSFLVEFNNQ